MAIELISAREDHRSAAVPSVAGITTKYRRQTSHLIGCQKEARVAGLAGLELPGLDKPAARQSVINLARVWQIMAASSKDYAELAKITRGRNCVIFGKYDLNLRKPEIIPLISGGVVFSTSVSMVDPEMRKGTFLTNVLWGEKVVAEAKAGLVFDPFPVTPEFMAKLAAAQRKQAVMPPAVPQQEDSEFIIGKLHSNLELPEITYNVTEERGAETAELSGDKQGVHDPHLCVKLGPNGEFLYDNMGRIITYTDGQKQGSKVRFGDLTRFKGPLAHGVLAALIALMGIARVGDLAGEDIVVAVENASFVFTGPVKYGRRLRVAEKITDVLPGKARIESVCLTEDGEVMRSKFLVDLVSNIYRH